MEKEGLQGTQDQPQVAREFGAGVGDQPVSAPEACGPQIEARDLELRALAARDALQSLDEGYCLAELVFDSTGRAVDYRFIEVNRAFAEMTGLANVEGHAIRELVPDLERKWVERYAEVVRSGHATRFCDDSEVMGRWFDVYAAPVGDGRRFTIIFKDVTARRASEDALARSEQRFRTLADNISQLVWMADSGGWIFWYNRRWFDYTGTTLDEMQGWGWTKVHHPDHVERVVERARAAWRSGEVLEELFPLRRADGVYRWFLTRAVPIRDAEGQVVRWFGTNTDVTDQRAIEEQLRASSDSRRLAMRSARAGAWRSGLSSASVEPSAELCALLGIPAPPPGRHLSWAEIVHPADLEDFEQQLRELLEGDETEFSIEHRVASVAGEARWFECVAAIVRDEAGLATACHGIALDISERKRREAKMQTVMAELNHRVKNTLAVVQSIAKRTARHALDLPEFTSRFEDRLRAIAKANALLTRGEWKGTELRTIVESELFAGLAPRDQVRVEGEHWTAPPDAALALHMVFHEWATNAAKYGGLSLAGGSVEVRWVRASDPIHGHGIELEWLEQVPTPVAPPRQRGFGTQLVEQLVRHDLGGAVDSEYLPSGVRHVLRIPLVPGGAIARNGALRPTPCERVKGARGIRVLLAEDRAVLAFGLMEELQELGFDVLGPVGTIVDLEHLVAHEPFDVALLDLDLQGQSSAPVAARLIADGHRVVLLTGYGERDLAAGLAAAVHLEKPVELEQLVRVLDLGSPQDSPTCMGTAQSAKDIAPHAQRVAGASPLAHDVRNVFATIRLSIGSLRRGSPNDAATLASLDEDLQELYGHVLGLLEAEAGRAAADGKASLP